MSIRIKRWHLDWSWLYIVMTEGYCEGGGVVGGEEGEEVFEVGAAWGGVMRRVRVRRIKRVEDGGGGGKGK